ncbi:hypothetical protein SAMD00079811_23970 [Scytonema sp. HK-05]|uniref:hypothetical protein n=1 Tax=Scytonema sp. HK-05 TaxID=1137095 RepID=UPI000937023D|nr:hypothetical protein [Scytonema sp. HK-05]OKH60413.1 hypothetical protein NIES2130_03175 [Scytonema sp. HK-05]BAY44795.1 hypothetical protein SAMD00079811_23970 [Scytonema sp. HK-05]
MFATVIVSWIVFTLLLKVVKTTMKTAFIAAVTIVLLHAAFGISPQDIWYQIILVPQTLSQVVRVR